MLLPRKDILLGSKESPWKRALLFLHCPPLCFAFAIASAQFSGEEDSAK